MEREYLSGHRYEITGMLRTHKEQVVGDCIGEGAASFCHDKLRGTLVEL